MQRGVRALPAAPQRLVESVPCPSALGNGIRAFAMGVIWMAGMAAYGIGASRMGGLGKSLGWAILMSSMVLVAHVLGLLTGEWTDVPPRAKRRLALGIGVLLLAIAGLGYANSLASGRASESNWTRRSNRSGNGTARYITVGARHDVDP